MSGICSAHRGHNPSCSRCRAMSGVPSTPEGKLATVEAVLGAGLLHGCPWCGGTHEHEHGVCAGRAPNPDNANGAADQKPAAEVQRLREQLDAVFRDETARLRERRRCRAIVLRFFGNDFKSNQALQEIDGSEGDNG